MSLDQVGARSEAAAPCVFVALGSNLGDSRDILVRAMDRLERLSTRRLLRSSLWRSQPVDCPPGSPPFINAALGLHPTPEETPITLLRKLQALEKEFGRRPKTVLNEPRPLDLDLVAFADIVMTTPELTLPHPRTQLRGFVLAPLAEIAPDFRLPGQSQTVRQLLESLGPAQHLGVIR